MVVTWNAAPGAAYYTVARGSVQIGNNTATSTVSAAYNLQPGTSYLFNVTAYGNMGQPGNSVTCSGTTGHFILTLKLYLFS